MTFHVTKLITYDSNQLIKEIKDAILGLYCGNNQETDVATWEFTRPFEFFKDLKYEKLPVCRVDLFEKSIELIFQLNEGYQHEGIPLCYIELLINLMNVSKNSNHNGIMFKKSNISSRCPSKGDVSLGLSENMFAVEDNEVPFHFNHIDVPGLDSKTNKCNSITPKLDQQHQVYRKSDLKTCDNSKNTTATSGLNSADITFMNSLNDKSFLSEI